MKQLRMLGMLLTLILAASPAQATPPAPADVQPTLPLRAAFYYAWYPEAWTVHNVFPYSNYVPSLGFYNSGDTSVIQQHIAAMQYGRIGAGIVWWEGVGETGDQRMPALLNAAKDTPFRWALYDVLEGRGDPAPEAIAANLAYIHDSFGTHPAYLRIGGRFVVFVSIDGADGCAMVERWRQANSLNAYLVMQVFDGYPACATQPDGWHQYSPNIALDWQVPYSVTISPGYWKFGEQPRLARDLTRWKANVRSMAASGATFQIIGTFNRWGESSAVESAREWESESGFGAYLDALHINGAESVFLPLAGHYPSGLCDAYEPNDDRASQVYGPIRSGERISAKLCAADQDNYSFTTRTNGQIQVQLTIPRKLLGHTTLLLYDKQDLRQNHEVFAQTNIGIANYTRLISLPHAGDYILRLYASGTSDPDNSYTLTVLYE